FPPIQILVLSAAFALLAFPLMRLTGNSAFARHAEEHAGHDHDEHDHHDHEEGAPKVVQGGTEHPEGEHVHEAVPALLRLRYAHKPLSVSLKQDGKELLKEADLSATPIEVKAGIGLSHDGNEMELTATWPPGTPETALTLEIEPDGFEARTETRWAPASELNEILTFKW
ncbi:MAG TPA: hypothetical protein VD994_16135, partial [Prosthecobacter sp.]|nr:hypothetical protein [Prosthecobacter sp.]